MTKKNSKRFQGNPVTLATTAEVSMNWTITGRSQMSTLAVLNDLYLVETDPPAKYEGSLTIPDEYKAYYENLPETGIVVAYGSLAKYGIPLGAKVRFGKHCGQRLKHEGKDYQLIREYDLLAIYDEHEDYT